jgi:two-component system, NtrC family, sensor kinase
MGLDIIIAVVVFYYFRKIAKEEGEEPTPYDKYLFSALIFSIVLLFLDMANLIGEAVSVFFAATILAGAYYLVYNFQKYAKAKLLLNAVLPFLAINFVAKIIEAIDKKFYKNFDGIFDTAIFFAIAWAIFMYITFRKQRKALELERIKALTREKQFQITESLKASLEIQVAERTAELTKQKEELQTTLIELQETQAQLIQSEKMASLGELTAGIAHEIQNPLNFVNNFSEVSIELIGEMAEELQKGDIEEAKVIAEDIKFNLEKINHHGKRADGIVKGMLQHSRSNTGVKESTDINALADEYLRLSFHGLRAKDKTFNSGFKTEFDPNIPKMMVVPQDLGRVLLNLINNAFFAVNDKSKKSKEEGIAFSPEVLVHTVLKKNTVEITVKDNGIGVPEDLKNKIFQPFFTTKPTGQGTGLGLSLSYDIVKAHGGELKLFSKQGEGTSFTLILPLKLSSE